MLHRAAVRSSVCQLYLLRMFAGLAEINGTNIHAHNAQTICYTILTQTQFGRYQFYMTRSDNATEKQPKVLFIAHR